MAAKVRLDGRRNKEEVLQELERVSDGYSRTVELVAHGQPGIAAAFHVAAALRSTARAPAFALADASTAARLKNGEGRAEAWALARPGAGAADGADTGAAARAQEERGNFSPGKVYHLSVPPATEWRAQVQRRLDVRLRVGNSTKILGLSKALATRSAPLPEGRGVAVETVLLGDEKLRRIRISIMAKALVRAYHWQVLPNDAGRPTRPFRCVAEIFKEEVDTPPKGGQPDCWVLSLEVLPVGPPNLYGPQDSG